MIQKKEPRKYLTVMEAREGNWPLVDDLQKSAEARGWGLIRLKKINSDRIARFDFDEIPLDYVVFRDLSDSGYVETERVFDFLRANEKIAMNINTTGGRTFTSDKHYQQGLFLLDPVLKEYALPTFEAKSKENVLSYVKGGRVNFPLVLKHRWGSIGKNITLIREEKDLDKIKNYNGLLIEQYIEPECDFRVFVIGGAAVGVMRKKGDLEHPENFEAWSAGWDKKREEDAEVVEFLNELACRVAAVAHLEYAGVDVIREKGTGKYYLLEVNVAAGWMNFVKPTGINVADKVMDWFCDMAEGQEMEPSEAVKIYVENRMSYVTKEVSGLYQDILAGKPKTGEKCEKFFENEPARYLCDTGKIYVKLCEAYEKVAGGSDVSEFKGLIEMISEMPLSWVGNMIGPKVGTLTQGALLSAMYLYLLGKSREV